MNGIENIIAKIASERDSEIESIKAEAFRRCEEIRQAGEKAAKAEYAKIVSKGVADAAVRIERLGSVAALEAKKIELAAKQEMVGKAFDRVIEVLSQLPEEKYVDFLASLALKASNTGNEKIILSPSDRARYGKAVCKKANDALSARGGNASLTLSERTADIRGGLILLLDSGDVEVNCSIEALVAAERHNMASKVAAVLFD